MGKTGWSIRGTLSLLTLAALLPALVLVAGFGLERRAHDTEMVLAEGRALARSLAAQQAQATDGLRRMLGILALLPETQAMDPSAVHPILKAQLADNPGYANIVLARANGMIVATARPGDIPLDISGRQYFLLAKARRAFSAGECQRGSYTGHHILPFSLPVLRPDGEFRGVISASFRLDARREFLDQAVLPAGTRVDFLDREGVRLFSHPEDPASRPGESLDPAVWSLLASREGEEDSFEGADQAGRSLLFSYCRLRLPGDTGPYLTVLLRAPAEAAFREADALTRRSLLFVAGAMLLALLAGWMAGERLIVRGVKGLVRAARALGGGRLSARAAPGRVCRELSELAENFNEMAARLEARDREGREAQADLELSRGRMQEALSWKEGILEASSAGIVVTARDLTVLEANRRAVELFGVAAGEMEGRVLNWFFLAPGEAQALLALVGTPGEAGAGQPAECLLRRPGGSFWGDVSVARIADRGGSACLVWFFLDITGRKQVEASLRESGERLELALAGADQAPWDWNAVTGRVVASPRLAEMAGYDPARVPDNVDFWEGLIHPEDLPRVMAQRLEHFQGRTLMYETEYRQLQRDGSWKWCVARGRAVERAADGMPLRITGTHQDIDARVRMEGELYQAKVLAEQASRAKSEFLANMSHEVRTPLNGVLGALRLLETTPLTGDQREFVDTALSSGQSLLTVINDILDFARIDTGRVQAREYEFMPGDLLRSLAGTFARPAREKGLVLALAADPALPPVLLGDEGRLRQILFNLVGNAIKFTPRGEVRIRLAPAPSEPGDGPRTLRLAATVRDTGMGIPPEKLDALFDPFTQADGSYSRRHAGLGLGLAIVQRLTRLLGGTVAIESEPGSGTTVRLCLPLQRAEGAEQLQEAAWEAPQARPGLRVLLAEDDRVNRMTTARLLEVRGLRVSQAANGLEALGALAASAHDLVLMDVQMPVMDGLEATRLIREGADPNIDPGLPVVALTAHAVPGDRERFLEAGMDDYVSKPLDLDHLLAAMERAMARRGRQPS